MRFILAPDSFKENMTALEAAEAMRLGVRDVHPDADCVLVPMSDGGEGFIDAVATAWGADRVEIESVDALGRPIRSAYALAGIELVAPEDRNVAASNTFGLGVLIRDALGRGAKEILIGIGGSATNDAGAGILGLDIPKESQTLTVFGAADALDPASQTWEFMPETRISDEASFQARWNDKRVVVRVRAEDADVQATDAVKLTTADGSFRIPRSGGEGSGVPLAGLNALRFFYGRFCRS